jgi:serine/threonine-protein kinase
MAEVFAARVSGEAGFQKLVAVKRMLPGLADDEEFVTMFLDEARVAAHIESPHVVTTHDLGRAEDGSLYIAMELVVGATLSRILRTYARRNAWIPVPIAVELLRQAAQGLQDAHDATTPVGAPLQIVHRDVSPQNILAGIDGRVRLTDFGVARAVLRMTHTVGGRVKGKFAYASPEQLAAQDVDRRSDVFSLGIVAWELLSGQRLFMGEHPMETIDRVRNMPIPAVQHVRSEVPVAISDVIARALDRDMDSRMPSAREFGRALVDAARESGMATPERDELRRFVRDAGGDDLAKVQDNIKRAMESRDTLLSVNVPVEVEGTGSHGGRSGVMVREGSGPTDKELTEARTAALTPSVSARSSPGPGSLIEVSADLPPRQRSNAFLAIAAGVLVAVGSAIGWWFTRDDGDAGDVVVSLPDPVVVPAAAAPVPEEPEPVVVGEDPVVVAEPLQETDSPEPAVESDDGWTARDRRVRRNARRRARAVAESSPEQTSAPQPPATSTAREPTRETARRQEQAPPAQTGTTTTTMRSGGFVGLDAFERDLERRR